MPHRPVTRPSRRSGLSGARCERVRQADGAFRPFCHFVQQAHGSLVRDQFDDAVTAEHGVTLTVTRPSSKAIEKSSTAPRASASSRRSVRAAGLPRARSRNGDKMRHIAAGWRGRALIADRQTGQRTRAILRNKYKSGAE